MRDEKLSDDYTVTSEVIKDFYKKIRNIYKNIKIICCIYPANPLLSKDNLAKASKILLNNKYDYVFSATKYQHPIQRAFYKKIIVYLCTIQNIQKSEHKILKILHDAGQFFLGS